MKLKMYAAVRTDFGKLPHGKLSNQTGHAYVHSFVAASHRLQKEYVEDPSHAKITVKARDQEHLEALADACDQLGVPFHLVTDEGRTHFDEPTMTCIGIGPLSPDKAEKILDLSTLSLY